MAQTTIDPIEGYPFFGWDRESVKSYILDKPLIKGDVMIIHNSHGGFHRYQLAVVDTPEYGPQRRVALSKSGWSGGCAFFRTGVNCFSPTGQTTMIPPVEPLMAYLTLDCDVVLDIPPYA